MFAENLDKAGRAIQNLLQYDQRRSKHGTINFRKTASLVVFKNTSQKYTTVNVYLIPPANLSSGGSNYNVDKAYNYIYFTARVGTIFYSSIFYQNDRVTCKVTYNHDKISLSGVDSAIQ